MSRLLGEPFSDSEREQLLANARAMLDMPWRHKGTRTSGADCVQFLRLAFNSIRPIPATRMDYGRTPHNGKLESGLTEYLGPPAHGPMQPCDIVTMRWTGEAHHVGLIVPHWHYGIGLIHADNTATGGPRVVEHGIDKFWRQRILQWWRP
jgi:hypothetical protein